MSNTTRPSIDRILRREVPRGLPYGFAERVARAAMRSTLARSSWEYLLELTPRTGLALSAVASLLIVYGFSGSGVDVLDAITSYAVLSQPLPLP